MQELNMQTLANSLPESLKSLQIQRKIKQKEKCYFNLLQSSREAISQMLIQLIESNISCRDQSHHQKKEKTLGKQQNANNLLKFMKKLFMKTIKDLLDFLFFVQYVVSSKISHQKLNFTPCLESEKLNVMPVHSDTDIVISKNQSYFLMYKMEPKSVKEVCSQKGMTIGHQNQNMDQRVCSRKKSSLKQTDKYLFFKGETLTKHVPKKDIVEIEVRFSKLYNLNFNIGQLKLHISEDQMPEVKILKTSLDKINLDKNMEVIVKLSIICMKSGSIQLQGISLQTNDSLTVFFVNDLLLFVGMEPEHKSQMVLQNTSEFNIGQDLI